MKNIGFCIICDKELFDDGSPILEPNKKFICSQCCIDLIEPIYRLSGVGGFQHLIFQTCLESRYNRKHRRSIGNYKIILKKLLPKYNFQCLFCSSKESLTIDHIKPVSKGGTDVVSNLQILCKSCNSKKNNHYE